MLLTPLAILMGVLVGLARGGKLPSFARLGLRWAPVLALGLVAQTVADQRAMTGGTTLLVLGSFVLILGMVRNLHLKGMTIVSIGMLLNLTALAVNGHVPVRFDSLVAVNPDLTRESVISVGAVRQIESDSTSLAFLGDIVPIPVLNDVISFGDLILMAGLFVVFMNVMLLKRRQGISIDELLGNPDPYEALGIDGTLESARLAAPYTEAESVVHARALSAEESFDADTLIDLSDPDVDLTETVWAEEESTDLSNSEAELLAPFPYPDSSTR